MVTSNYKLDSFINYFSGREDFIAVQGNDYYYPIEAILDDRIVAKHIDGIETFGVYVLNKLNQCNFICLDIDIDKSELENIDFLNAQAKFSHLKVKLFKCKELLENELFASENVLYEDSGGRGYHIWIFFDNPIDGQKALYLNEVLKSKLDFAFEFFPKQPTLNDKRKYGNLIKLPLGEHKKYKQRSQFFILNDKIVLLSDINQNIKHIDEIKRVNSTHIESIIEKYSHIVKYNSKTLIKESYTSNRRRFYEQDYTKLYSQCGAINRLKDKALLGKPLSHSEIFHLSNTLLSVKDSAVEIHKLIKSSFKNEYSLEATNRELALIAQFNPANCKTLIKKGICSGYCKEEFINRNEDPLLNNTSPLHFLTSIKIIKENNISSNLLNKIAQPENISSAYYKLREYHKNEDVLFFDEFDFEFFESDFDNNIQQISVIFKNKIKIPPINYEKVVITKKIDEKGEKAYRELWLFKVLNG